jgi:hypothetical protein
MLACAIALILLVDVSGSVTQTNYELQKRGLALAFQDPQVQKTIESQPGGVALAVHEWTDTTDVVISWVLLKNKTDSEQFASKILNLKYPHGMSTAMGDAIAKAVDYFESAPCEPDRKVLDVSGDGASNSGLDIEISRKKAIDNLVTINGMPILTPVEPQVMEYYRDNVISPDGFLVAAHGYEDFTRAIKRKLIMEIAKN